MTLQELNDLKANINRYEVDKEYWKQEKQKYQKELDVIKHEQIDQDEKYVVVSIKDMIKECQENIQKCDVEIKKLLDQYQKVV